jgi:hypothetical protein
MSILKDGRRPATGPDSHDALDRAVVAGFVTPGVVLSHGRRKLLVTRLRARMIAVDAWTLSGRRLTQKALAKQLGISDRGLSLHFPVLGAVYAFPPPELALSMCGASVKATAWDDIAASLVPVFQALDGNPHGRSLLSGLVRLHRAHQELADADGYFAHAMRDAISTKRERSTLAICGLFTDGFRTILEDWVDQDEPSLMYVAERVDQLLIGPVQNAYAAFR